MCYVLLKFINQKNMKKIVSYIVSSVLGFGALFSYASAHVGYVIEHEEFLSHQGEDTRFLLNGITENMSQFVVAGLITLALVGIVLFVRSRKQVARYLATVQGKLVSYYELLPWMARLALGIALIGAGTAQVFISPVMEYVPHTALLEILLGFFFLLGFLIVPASLVTIGLFVYGLVHNPYLFGNLDFLALTLAVFLLGSGRPGLDDILSIDSFKRLKHADLVPLVLRIGLGVAFFYLGMYEKFLNPHDSELVVTTYHLTNVIDVAPALWVLGAGLVECTLGILLVLGFETRLVAVVSFVVISLSFFYFKESVYSHVTLFAALSMLVVTGAGTYSIDRYLQRKKQNSNPA